VVPVILEGVCWATFWATFSPNHLVALPSSRAPAPARAQAVQHRQKIARALFCFRLSRARQQLGGRRVKKFSRKKSFFFQFVRSPDRGGRTSKSRLAISSKIKVFSEREKVFESGFLC
jgi:hypothetical protein